MKKALQATICALALANVAYPCWVIASKHALGVPDKALPDILPQALRPVDASSQASPSPAAAAGPQAACMKIIGLGASERDVALGAFGAALGAKAYPNPSEAWALEWTLPYTERGQAEEVARELAARGGPAFKVVKAGASWTLRLEGFESQAAATAAISGKFIKGLAAKKVEREAYDIRFGPWPLAEVAALAKSAAGMGAAGSEPCNQQEKQAWEQSKK